MVLLIGVSWQFPMLLLGIANPHSGSWEAPFILLNIVHGPTHFFVPLYFMGLLSGIRRRLVLKPNRREQLDITFGIECKTRGCKWATPELRTTEAAYLREEIHTKATGHTSYGLLMTREVQLEVI